MLPRLLFGLIAAASLGLAGCAHSPQQLTVQPVVTAPLAAVGQGQPVAVKVVDGRSSPVLGTRGGLYPDSSTVSVDRKSLETRLQGQAEAAVRLLGFTPTPNAAGIPQLTLTVTDMKYLSPKDSSYVTQADISAAIRADVQNSARRYSGRYAASLHQRFGMSPNQETNSKLVSDVLGDALTRVFKDPEVGRVLGNQ